MTAAEIAHHLRRRVQAARLVVTLETVWPALWPVVAVLGSFLALSLFGLWQILPPSLHLLGLLAGMVLLGWTSWRAWPTLRLAPRSRGLARLEADSGIAHQPLRGLEDNLPTAVRDPLTRRLWDLHRERLERAIATLRLSPPRSLLPARDPWALRGLLLLVLVVAFVHAGGGIGDKLASILSFTQPSAAAVPPRVDLWITPPAYTGRPPLGADQTRARGRLDVPVGSMALVQVHHLPDGAGEPGLALDKAVIPFASLGGDSAEARVKLEAGGRLVVRDPAGSDLAAWTVGVLPDRAPTVRFARPPEATYRGTLRIEAAAEDDYGLSELALLMAPADHPDTVQRLPLVKPANRPRSYKAGSFLDLTAHPLAGLPVTLRLVAVDGLGQEGQSEPVRITLPEREFHHPLARAIIEQRRELVRDPSQAPEIAARLAFLGDTDLARQLPATVPLSLRAAAARLSLNDDPASRASVVTLLWEIALYIEDGSLSVAERRLREIQDKLQQALNQGAKDQELERLMQEMQQALNNFLDEMQRKAQAQMQNGQQQQQPLQNGRQQTVDRQDLQRMLDQAREMMRSGAKDSARQMLAQLQQMLENLKAGTAQAQSSPGQQAMSDLQKMIQLQQQLLQRSFEMQRQQRGSQSGQQPGQEQGQQGQQQEGQAQQPGQGQPGQEGMGQSAQEQDALRRALGELMRRLGDAGMDIPRAMGQAELQMREAMRNLKGGEPGPAAQAQNQAVDAMQRAGQAMMQQLQQQMGQQPGPGQEPTAERRGRDPLGRAMRNDGGYDTQGVAVPDQGDLGRARDVLDELYRRSGDRQRPPAELDYYKRLLDRF